MNRYLLIIMYLIGFPVFGMIYWLLDNILTIIIPMNFQDTTNFMSTFELVRYIWAGIVIVYLLFGGIWMMRVFTQDTMPGVID